MEEPQPQPKKKPFRNKTMCSIGLDLKVKQRLEAYVESLDEVYKSWDHFFTCLLDYLEAERNKA